MKKSKKIADDIYEDLEKSLDELHTSLKAYKRKKIPNKPKIEKRDKIWVTKGFWKDGIPRVIYCSSWHSASYYAQKSREWWEGSQ